MIEPVRKATAPAPAADERNRDRARERVVEEHEARLFQPRFSERVRAEIDGVGHVAVDRGRDRAERGARPRAPTARPPSVAAGARWTRARRGPSGGSFGSSHPTAFDDGDARGVLDGRDERQSRLDDDLPVRLRQPLALEDDLDGERVALAGLAPGTTCAAARPGTSGSTPIACRPLNEKSVPHPDAMPTTSATSPIATRKNATRRRTARR